MPGKRRQSFSLPGEAFIGTKDSNALVPAIALCAFETVGALLLFAGSLLSMEYITKKEETAEHAEGDRPGRIALAVMARETSVPFSRDVIPLMSCQKSSNQTTPATPSPACPSRPKHFRTEEVQESINNRVMLGNIARLGTPILLPLTVPREGTS